MWRVVESDPAVEVIDAFSVYENGEWRDTYLSNGYIEPDGTFVEREYQAAKTLDEVAARQILACNRPFGSGGSKKLGRAAPLRPDWERVKYQVMARLVTAKFRDHPALAAQLVATGDALLVEGNMWHDNVWGDCRCGGPECVKPGLNLLGHILMSVRETLR